MTGLNAARGEVALTIDGRARRLCLTLGALAEIETALGVEEGTSLADRLGRLTARDLAALLAALLRGGGEAEAADTLSTARIDPVEATRAVAAALAAAAR